MNCNYGVGNATFITDVIHFQLQCLGWHFTQACHSQGIVREISVFLRVREKLGILFVVPIDVYF